MKHIAPCPTLAEVAPRFGGDGGGATPPRLRSLLASEGVKCLPRHCDQASSLEKQSLPEAPNPSILPLPTTHATEHPIHKPSSAFAYKYGIKFPVFIRSILRRNTVGIVVGNGEVWGGEIIWVLLGIL